MITQTQERTEKPAFNEYPITLAHPAFAPSKPIPVPGSQVYDRQGNVIRQDYHGTPERYSPVTANSEAEEEYYAAQGYVRAGKMDPAAWVSAHADAVPADYVPAKYPMWKDGVLIASATEDPDAEDGDIEVAVAPEIEPPPSEAADLRAKMDEMYRTMAEMTKVMKEQADENARLRGDQSGDDAQSPRRGRPRKVTPDA